MAKMTLAWVVIYCTLVIASFINPLYGTLGYLFEYYLRPSMHWWGQALPDLRWNFTIAAVLTFTFLLRRSSLPDIGPARRGPGLCLAGLLFIMLLVTPTTAVNPTLSWNSTTNFSKLILFHGLLVGTVRTELGFDAVAAMHMAGAGWWGWEAYTNPKRAAGRLENVGSGDTLGDNGTAAQILTVLPFIAVYLLVSKNKKLKGLAFLVAPFVLNTFILCNSRGALLALIAAGAAAVWLTRSGHRLGTAVAGVALAGALFYLADPQFLQRQQFTTDYESDGSAMGRIDAWRGAVQLVKDYPLGAGGQGFWELSPVYVADLVDRMREKRDPHNTVVLVASEWGIPGLTLYLLYYFTAFMLLADVRKRALNAMWYYRSVAVQLAMIGVFVAGLFTDRLYAEAPYWMGALAVALQRIHAHALRPESIAAEASQPRESTVAPPVPALSRA
jgi:O-antigen ligase